MPQVELDLRRVGLQLPYPLIHLTFLLILVSGPFVVITFPSHFINLVLRLISGYLRFASLSKFFLLDYLSQ